jgi:predicted ATP-grasp superfamily ATP-dependent carboligase
MIRARGGHVLIVGVTTRALAISAARAGYRVSAVDAFGDMDLQAAAEVIPSAPVDGRKFDPSLAAELGSRLGAEFAAYTSNLENHPAAVSRLTRSSRLLGNPPDVLERVRNPFELMRALRRAGFEVPRTRASSPTKTRRGFHWVLKPRLSGGGHGMSLWRRGITIPRSHYLQERIAGIPGSIVFAADGREAVALGLSRQLIAEARFGAPPFRYCGNLLTGGAQPLFPRQQQLEETAVQLANYVSREFRLVGLNGIDFIARRGIPYPIEVNPRYSASMELVERAHAISLFEVHANACGGSLPRSLPNPGAVHGKAIVYARCDVTMGATSRWLGRPGYADIPHPGEVIASGRPICTVLAAAPEAEACLGLLQARAARVYRLAKPQTRRAA